MNSANGKTDFTTNNQESGVDEPALVKSDGRFVYVANGDILVVWDAITGDMVTNITMPAFNNTQGGYWGTSLRVKANAAAGLPTSITWYPKAQIQSLLFKDNSLVLFINGYGYANHDDIKVVSMYGDLLATRIQVYNTATLASNGVLVLQKEIDVNGYFRDARLIGSSIHLVTVASVSSGFLWAPINKFQQNHSDLSTEEYVANVTTFAKEELIPTFVDGLLSEMCLNCNGNFAQINMWQLQPSNNTIFEEKIYGAGILKTLIQVYSFDLLDTSGNFNFSLSGAFMPSFWGYTYATDEMLVLTAQSWYWDALLNGTTETTFLLGLKVDKASTRLHTVGVLDGCLFNQYALDIFEGTLRAATSILWLWSFSLDEENSGGGFPQQQSILRNDVTTFEIPTAAGEELAVVGKAERIGKEGQVFSSVYFFDKIAYAYAYYAGNDGTNPLHILNVTDPANPSVVGLLEINNFTPSYLYSMTGDSTLLLAVGMGMIEYGLDLVVIDAMDPGSPVVVQRHDTNEGSSALNVMITDSTNFNYLSLGSDYGLAIISMHIYNATNSFDVLFDGFIVFDVSHNGISERMRISQGSPEYEIYNGISLVFNGDMMTMKGNSSLSTNLDSGEMVWQSLF